MPERPDPSQRPPGVARTRSTASIAETLAHLEQLHLRAERLLGRAIVPRPVGASPRTAEPVVAATAGTAGRRERVTLEPRVADQDGDLRTLRAELDGQRAAYDRALGELHAQLDRERDTVLQYARQLAQQTAQCAALQREVARQSDLLRRVSATADRGASARRRPPAPR